MQRNVTEAHLIEHAVKTELQQWFERRADDVDLEHVPAQEGIAFLAERNLLSVGIPRDVGGAGGTLEHMAEIVSTIASRCLTSAFVVWSHRMFTQYVHCSDNDGLKERLFPSLFQGDLFGASGLANVLKYSSAIEELSVSARPNGNGGYTVSGFIPWASNIVAGEFIIAVAAGVDDGHFVVVSVPADRIGLNPSEQRSLIGLNGTSSASIRFEDVPVSADDVISVDGETFLTRIRPALILLQSALAWGVAKVSLDASLPKLTGSREVLKKRGHRLQHKLEDLVVELRTLCVEASGNGIHHDLFQLRACTVRQRLTELVTDAVWLEVEATGGAAYVATSATARRLRESAFFPIQSPSLVHLTIEIDRLRHHLSNQADAFPTAFGQ